MQCSRQNSSTHEMACMSVDDDHHRVLPRSPEQSTLVVQGCTIGIVSLNEIVVQEGDERCSVRPTTWCLHVNACASVSETSACIDHTARW